MIPLGTVSGNRAHRAPGFTLLELLVAIAVAVLIAGWAVPSFHHLVLNARRTAHVNAFVSSVHLAHNEAVKRALRVVLCKSPDGVTCVRDDNIGWETGWLVFANLDADDPPRVDAGEPVVLVHGAARRARIRANREAFTFRPFELRATNGTVVFCDERGPAHARAVIVSPTGRPRTAGTDAAGDPLQCPEADE